MEIYFSVSGGALAVVFKGKYDFDCIIKSCVDLKKEKESCKTKGLILDFSRLNDGVSIFDSFAFARKLRGVCRGNEKIAFVRKNGLLEGEGVCAEIIYNMGFNIEVFGDKEKASDWVQGK